MSSSKNSDRNPDPSFNSAIASPCSRMPLKRFNETEKAAFSFIDGYLLNSPDLIAGDVEHTVQHILNEFMESKVK